MVPNALVPPVRIRLRTLAVHALAITLIGAIVSPEAYAQDDSFAEPHPAFAEAEKSGLVIRGIQDEEGLRRVVEHYLDGLRPGEWLRDSKVAEALGVDFETLRELESMIRMSDLLVYRVEMMPGPTGQPGTDVPSRDVKDLESDGFTPGFPSRGSLVGTKGYSSHTVSHGPGYGVEVNTYPDGSSWLRSFVTNSAGVTVSVEQTVNPDGSIRHSHVVTEGNDGPRRETTTDQENGPPNMAEAERKDEEARREEAARGEEAPAEDAGEGEDVDQFQPPDGAGGTFCPLTVEICRRGFEEALASGQKLLVGMVLVNPGDPDDQPAASRLVYDTKDLVINPDPERTRRRDSATDPRRFRMDIPVWVNPPGPGEN